VLEWEEVVLSIGETEEYGGKEAVVDSIEEPRCSRLLDFRSAESFSQTTLAMGRSLGCCTQHCSTICQMGSVS